MCRPASFVLTKDTTFWSENSDSHEVIIKENKLNDLPNVRDEPRIVRCEIYPPDNQWKLPLSKWEFHLDQDVLPKWFDKKEAEKRVRKELPNWVKSNIVKANQTIEEIKEGYKAAILGKVKCISGSANIERVYGSAHINTVYGSARIDIVSGSARIGDVFGSAHINDVSGSARIGDVFGSAIINDVYDYARIGDVGGSAHIERVYDSAHINTVCGSAIIDNVSGSAIIDNVSGSAIIDNVFGSAIINDVYDYARIGDVGGSAVVQVYNKKCNVTPKDNAVIIYRNKNNTITKIKANI